MAPSKMSRLCSVCKSINFAAIFTPYEHVDEGRERRLLYRPEYKGHGGDPSATFYCGKTKRTGPPEKYLPQIRIASYYDLSDSDESDDDDDDKEKDIEAHVPSAVPADRKPGGSVVEGQLPQEREDGPDADPLSAENKDAQFEGQKGDRESPGPEESSQQGAGSIEKEGNLTGFPKPEEPATSSTELEIEEHIPVKDTNTIEKMLDASHGTVQDSTDYLEDLTDDEDVGNHSHDPSDEENMSDQQHHESDHEDDEDDSDSDDSEAGDSESTWSNNSHFTEHDRIDPDKQVEGMWNYHDNHLYYLGSIWDVRSRRRKCDFCKYLWGPIRNNLPVRDVYFTKSRCVLKLLELKGKRSDGSGRDVKILNLVFFFGVKVDDPSSGGWIMNMGLGFQGAHTDFCSLYEKTTPEEIVPFDDRFYGEARRTGELCNVTLFKEWLRKCESKHGHPRPVLAGDISIRLIDVEKRCLVEWSGPASELPRYVVLSYVWGKSEQRLMLTSEKLATFKEPGFLQRADMDATPRDAIDLVARLGERYLWVDVLCIVQDSGADKALHIPHMHEFYGSAVLTIVAAHGADADAGLPGVRAGSREANDFQLRLPDVVVSARCPMGVQAFEHGAAFLENYLIKSVWKRRAWTFQEGRLSARNLIFTESQVFWECERCTWCEETQWESDEVDFIGWRAVKDPTPDDVWHDRMDRKFYDMGVEPYDTIENHDRVRYSYGSAIKEFTGRDLSYHEDILDACTGVLSSMKEREQSDFIFGLRTRYFGNDLLFNPMEVLPRRFPRKRPVKIGFPTWSWAAWKGVIEIANEPRHNSWDPVENLVCCDGVKCYMLDVDASGQKSLRVINESGGWQFREGYERAGEGIADDTMLEEWAEIAEREKLGLDPLPSKIPEYSQDLSLADVQSHPAFSQLKPNFHIVFRTFATTVVLRTDWDELKRSFEAADATSPLKHRDGDIYDHRVNVIRKLFVCRKKSEEETLSSKGDQNAGKASEVKQHPQEINEDPKEKDQLDDNKIKADPIPEGMEQGPYVCNMPRRRPGQSLSEYINSMPDGVYRLLWMNNNQLPIWGHLLCRPVSRKASEYGDWDDGEILARVSGVSGPTGIMYRDRQERFAAKWGTFILS